MKMFLVRGVPEIGLYSFCSRNQHSDSAVEADVATATRISTPFYTSEEMFSILNSTALWDITPYSPLKVKGRFLGMCCLHFQDRKINQRRKQCESQWQAEQMGFLLGLFFYHEEGGNIFLRNDDCLSTDYTALYHRI
jgi:hypothetical protein